MKKSRQMNNEYIFVRHGQTYWNKNGIMHGQYDIPLNFTGIKQAKKISEELKSNHFDICFNSLNFVFMVDKSLSVFRSKMYFFAVIYNIESFIFFLRNFEGLFV